MSSSIESSRQLTVIIAILLPPVAVGPKKGIGLALIINIVLCLLFWMRDSLHALRVVLS